MSTLSPQAIVEELDKHIIGQKEAKRSVANALRNRWRRMQLDEATRSEIKPKNILMIGPTGVGKTEIARRLAKIAHAPFIKVEATKFTEVGFVGRDVESIVRDLIDVAIKMGRSEAMEAVKDKAEQAAEERILDALLPRPRNAFSGEPTEVAVETAQDSGVREESYPNTRKLFRDKLRAGELDDKEVEVEISANMGVEIMAPPGMEDMSSQLQSIFQDMRSERTQKRKLRVSHALRTLRDDEAAKLINDDDIKAQAIEQVEQNGIVFLDEIDKITRRADQGRGGADVSREGVQRDLLPLIEGCTVSTKHGSIKTDHILFIASGAFHLSKPSDLIPELQGRLPIRVELKALSTEDFERILVEPDVSLTEQYTALLGTESVDLHFDKDGVKRIAQIAWHVNEHTENIGARRLHTVMERLTEDLSFNAEQFADKRVTVDAAYVDERLAALSKDEDLSHYIL